MREWLAAARARGESFEQAWAEALRAPSQRHIGIHLPHATPERQQYLVAFESTKAEWAAAWHGIETPLSRALVEDGGGEDLSRPARVTPSDGPAWEIYPVMRTIPLMPPDERFAARARRERGVSELAAA
jgi:hypothetical protein